MAGVPGDRYTIEVRNRTHGRILSVVSVDGVNIVSGETAASSQRGYVLSPLSSTEVDGWRKSTKEVATFYFTNLSDSYAARTKRPDNLGVIGVAVFREEPEPVAYAPQQQSIGATVAPASKMAAESSRAAAGAMADTVANSLGTGHGERVASYSRVVDFKRASVSPSEVVEIRYDSYQNLVARGVIPVAYGHRVVPQAFPKDRYVPDPS